jgi:putative transposase
MSTQRQQDSAAFKARVALGALKGLNTVNALASTSGVHPTQMAHWQHRLPKEMPELFSARRAQREQGQEALPAPLYRQIGQRTGELDWLKKKLALPREAKREWIEPAHPQLSIARQCALVGLPRSTYYYHAQGGRTEKRTLMRLLDAPSTETPYEGVRRRAAG